MSLRTSAHTGVAIRFLKQEVLRADDIRPYNLLRFNFPELDILSGR